VAGYRSIIDPVRQTIQITLQWGWAFRLVQHDPLNWDYLQSVKSWPPASNRVMCPTTGLGFRAAATISTIWLPPALQTACVELRWLIESNSAEFLGRRILIENALPTCSFQATTTRMAVFSPHWPAGRLRSVNLHITTNVFVNASKSTALTRWSISLPASPIASKRITWLATSSKVPFFSIPTERPVPIPVLWSLGIREALDRLWERSRP